MAVPNIFANVTTSIPLSQLDTNFATAITLGNTAVYLGNTTTTLGNLTLTNVTIASGTSNIASTPTSIVNGTSNVSVVSSGGNVVVSTNGATAVTVDTGQRTTFPTTIGVGAATPSTSGSGITFPATQSASSNANTLDDYEEGSWTPTLGGSATYSTQRGGYVKVGRLVFIQCQLVVSAIGTGSTTTISGLPFSVSNPSGGADAYPQGAVGYLDGSNQLFYSVVCNPQANTSTVQFTAQSILGSGYQNVTAALFTTGTHIQFSSFYYTST
jgi:hypothetical protein